MISRKEFFSKLPDDVKKYIKNIFENYETEQNAKLLIAKMQLHDDDRLANITRMELNSIVPEKIVAIDVIIRGDKLDFRLYSQSSVMNIGNYNDGILIGCGEQELLEQERT